MSSDMEEIEDLKKRVANLEEMIRYLASVLKYGTNLGNMDKVYELLKENSWIKDGL